MAGPSELREKVNATSHVTALRGATLRGLGAVLILLLAFDGLCGLFLVQARENAQSAASQFAVNLSRAIGHDISRSVELYDRSLQAVQDGLKMPGLWQLPPELRDRVLFDNSASASGLGGMLVLNEHGDSILDSRSLIPRPINGADRPYFLMQAQNSARGLFIGEPIHSRLNNTLVLPLSRRIEHEDGSFAGVVIGTMQLNYFHDLLHTLLLGQAGTITLCDTAGTIIMQEPYAPETIGRKLGDSPIFAQIRRGKTDGAGTLVTEQDATPRLYAFQTVAGTRLLVSVTLSEDDVLSAWHKRAMAIGVIMLLLTGATLALTLLLWREFGRRAHAERAALAAGTALQSMNDTLEAQVNREIARREEAQGRLAQAQRMEALGQLAGGIAHDFNNVLQSVSGAGQRMLDHPDNVADVQRLSRLVLDVCARGSAITHRLLAFAHKGQAVSQPVAPRQLLTDLQQIMEHTFGRAYQIRVSAADDLPRLCADKPQLETVLINLATNARDAMPGGGVLTLSAETVTVTDATAHRTPVPAGDYIKLTVRDNGQGMDTNTLARASEPFFTTKPVGKGTGLGLSMAKGFARQADGALSIVSEVGRGTAVTLWLPQARPQTETEAAQAAMPETTRVAHILLVDDDTLICELLADELRERGHAVEQANDGTAALACMEALGKDGAAIDLLVTDLSLPGLDGMALIRAVRERHPDLPAIIVSGAASEENELDSCGAPCVFLTKPVRGADLAKQVQMMLNRSV